MGVADEFAGFAQETPPSGDALTFLDVVFAPLGEVVDDANQEIHRAGGRDYDNLLQIGVFDDIFYFGVGDINTEHHLGLGAVYIILNFLLGGEGVDHIGNSANFVDRVEHIDFFWGVGHTDSDTVTFLHADSLEGAGDFVNFFNKLPVGDFGVEIGDGGIVWPFTTGIINNIIEPTFGVIKLFGEFFYVTVFGAL